MKELIAKLHPLERKILPFLKDDATLNDLVKSSKLSDIEAMRAIQRLENKEVLKINTDEKEIIKLEITTPACNLMVNVLHTRFFPDCAHFLAFLSLSEVPISLRLFHEGSH